MDLPASDSWDLQSQPGDQSAQVERRQVDWWERFLALPPVVAAIGAVAVFFTPLYPQIIPFVVVWAFLYFCLVFYLLLQMGRELAKPRYRSVDRSADGASVVRQHRQYFVPLVFLIVAAGLLMFVSVLGMLNPDPLDPGGKLRFFVIDFALTLIIASLWFLSARGMGDALDKVLGRYRLAILCLLLVVGLFFRLDWSTLTDAPDGPAASWQAQLKFAQQQADRIEGGSILTSISAREQRATLPRPSAPDLQRPLDVNFVFRGLSGEDIEVDILDTDPPRLVSTYHNSRASVPLSADEKQRLVAAFSTVKLSPRQVFEQTLPEFEEKASGDVRFGSFTLDSDSEDTIQSFDGIPVEWIAYFDMGLFLGIDPSSGKVLWARNPSDNSNSTPTPVPTK